MSDKWTILKEFIPQEEGFLSHPKWDNKQWSWGYGTAAGFDRTKKPEGTITREKAWSDALAYLKHDYDRLISKIHVELTDNQWAALLSFAYNEGIGNANNLIADINSKSSNLETHIKKYIYSAGVKSNNLIGRRNREWELWTS